MGWSRSSHICQGTAIIPCIHPSSWTEKQINVENSCFGLNFSSFLKILEHEKNMHKKILKKSQLSKFVYLQLCMVTLTVRFTRNCQAARVNWKLCLSPLYIRKLLLVYIPLLYLHCRTQASQDTSEGKTTSWVDGPETAGILKHRSEQVIYVSCRLVSWLLPRSWVKICFLAS